MVPCVRVARDYAHITLFDFHITSERKGFLCTFYR